MKFSKREGDSYDEIIDKEDFDPFVTFAPVLYITCSVQLCKQ